MAPAAGQEGSSSRQSLLAGLSKQGDRKQVGNQSGNSMEKSVWNSTNFHMRFHLQVRPSWFTRSRKHYLFIMGDYLQFIGTELLLNTWSSDVLTHCKRLFDHHGIPDELTTENKL